MAFYEAVLGVLFEVQELAPGFLMARFVGGRLGGAGGALVWGPAHGYEPSSEGSLLYFAVNERLSDVLARVDDAGGEVLIPPYGLGTNGYAAVLLDCEGNRIALHGPEA